MIRHRAVLWPEEFPVAWLKEMHENLEFEESEPSHFLAGRTEYPSEQGEVLHEQLSSLEPGVRESLRHVVWLL